MLFSYLFVSCEKETAEIEIIEEEFPPSVDLITSGFKINVDDVDGNLVEELTINFLHEETVISTHETSEGELGIENQPVHFSSTLLRLNSNNYLPSYLTQVFEKDNDYLLDLKVKKSAEVKTIINTEKIEYRTVNGVNFSVEESALDYNDNALIIKAGIIEFSEVDELFPIQNSIDKNDAVSNLNLTSLFYIDLLSTNYEPIEINENEFISYQINGVFDTIKEYRLWNFNEVKRSWVEIEYTDLNNEYISFQSAETGYFYYGFISNCDSDSTSPITICELSFEYDYEQNGDGFVSDFDINDGSYDACPGELEFLIKRSFDICGDNSDVYGNMISICSDDIGNDVSVTLKVTDEDGNSNVCISNVKVIGSACLNDIAPPVLICEGSLTYDYSSQGDFFLTYDDVDDGSYDDCSSLMSLGVMKSVDSCGDGSDVFSDKVSVCAADIDVPFNVTLKLSDASGNTNTCITTVSVIASSCTNDLTVPIAIVKLDLDVSFASTIQVFARELDSGSHDNCTASSDLIFEILKLDDMCSSSSGSYSDKIDLCTNEIDSEVPVTIRVTDQNGNSNVAFSVVKVTN